MTRELRFREDGTLRVMQLTDLHYLGTGVESDARTLALMRELIAAEKPDFIMITGDTVFGERNVADFAEAIAPVLESGIPWAQVFGNHDSEVLGNRAELLAAVEALPNCIGIDDPAAGEGFGNFFLPVRDAEGDARWYIAGLDSGEGETYAPRGWPGQKQIRWYSDSIAAFEKAQEKDFSVLTFMHMDLPEYDEVWKYERCYGTRWENLSCCGRNSGFFGAMAADGHTRALFVGHAHTNNFHGTLDGITLGYGRDTGCGSYAPADYLRGARMFILRADDIKTLKTWERLEHGILLTEPWVKNPVETREEYALCPREE